MPRNPRTVSVIPASPEFNRENPTEPARLKVAAYCRVSTEQEQQQSSYEIQVDYYTRYISQNPEWELAGIYADGSDKIGLNQQSPYSKGGALI